MFCPSMHPRWLALLVSLTLAHGLQAQIPAPESLPAVEGLPTAEGLPQVRGFSMQLNDPAGTPRYLEAIDEMAQLGCTWINLVVAARQDNVKSDSVHMVWQNLPSMPEIKTLLRHAKKRHMRTILMPIVLLDKAGPKEWRGVIAPADWDHWFFTYGTYMNQFAATAQSCQVDILCVGSELLSTESFREHWLKVIKDVRNQFKGKLTYSANWDHYSVPTFWDQLDYIGMNNYNELAHGPGASVRELVEAWEPIRKAVLEFGLKKKKPIFFTEVGWHNLQNTIAEPWNYCAEGVIDPQEQLRAYQAFVEVWSKVPSRDFMGALIWEWKPGAKPTDFGSYSLQGQPAMDVVKTWLHGNK